MVRVGDAPPEHRDEVPPEETALFFQQDRSRRKEAGTDMKENTILSTVVIIAIGAVCIALALAIVQGVFRHIQKKRADILAVFLRRLISVGIILIGIVVILSALAGLNPIWTAIILVAGAIVLVIVFAAQGMLKDLLGGVLICIYKPFEIGDRISLEDGTTGVVKDITMRHVALIGLDTETFVVPNSKLNDMKITNYCYHRDNRSAKFNFYVALNSDMEKTLNVVREAIISSPLSLPGKEKDGKMEYGPVYFMAYEVTGFRVSTTVYYPANTPTEVLISDINLRVTRALAENGIEVPYPYINVVDKRQETGGK